MNTIRQLAMQWFNPLSSAEKTRLADTTTDNIGCRRWETLTGSEIENIFYNEVIIKWFHNDYYNTLVTPEAGYRANLMTADDIISLYLKEHSKEEPKQETIEDIKLEVVLESSHCQFSVVENKLATIYRNQEKILTAIKLLNNGK